MKKRKLHLDREILVADHGLGSGGNIGPILMWSLAIFSALSALEPPACDCLDTDSCGSDNGCGGGPTDAICPSDVGCHTDTPDGPNC